MSQPQAPPIAQPVFSQPQMVTSQVPFQTPGLHPQAPPTMSSQLALYQPQPQFPTGYGQPFIQQVQDTSLPLYVSHILP